MSQLRDLPDTQEQFDLQMQTSIHEISKIITYKTGIPLKLIHITYIFIWNLDKLHAGPYFLILLLTNINKLTLLEVHMQV